jgi:quinoprotein glucose dehydrogenase
MCALDAHRRRIWSFHTVPRDGERGSETWAGHRIAIPDTPTFGPRDPDERRGSHLPVSTPSNDFYGGNRLGAIFGDSLVCLDAKTAAPLAL